MYLSGNISDKVFCDEFYYSYDLEIDLDTLTNIEKKAFSELSTGSDRFSEFEEDHIKYPKGFLYRSRVVAKDNRNQREVTITKPAIADFVIKKEQVLLGRFSIYTGSGTLFQNATKGFP